MNYKLGLLAAALFMTMPSAFAKEDVLLATHPANAIVGTDDYLIPTIDSDTQNAIHQMATQWAGARTALATAENHKDTGELTKVDQAWLRKESQEKDLVGNGHSYSSLFRTHLIGRVHFYERSHNWNGENKNDKIYNYMTYKGGKDASSYTNSYGFNVLRTMADTMSQSMQEVEASDLQGDAFVADVEKRLTSIMEETQATVHNDELRYYANAAVEYTSKQVIKERSQYEPKEKTAHVVNLREAIQEDK